MPADVFAQILILITTAVAMSAVFRRLRIPATLAYLSVGMLLGPKALAVVANLEDFQFLAEFGVVFLLFSLGLEFSLPKLVALRRAVFELGSLQVLLCGLAIYAVTCMFGAHWTEASVVAAALALSSTAVVSKELVRRNEVHQAHGMTAIGILLFQDLAAVIFLIILPMLGANAESALLYNLALALAKGLLLFGFLLAVGKWLLPALFHEVAKAHSDELFLLAVLMVALLAAFLTHWFGLSMALGAFIAGMMLSETHYRHQIEADIKPFRDLLLGLFFINVGMLLDLQILVHQWYWILAACLALILLKTLVVFALVYGQRRDTEVALKTGLYLAQGGEFGFALFALANQNQLLSPVTSAIAIASVVLSIAATPALMSLAQRLSQRLSATSSTPQESRLEKVASLAEDLSGHAIICGFGRVGQTVGRFLRQSGFRFVAIDSDPLRVLEASQAGEPLCYGDARRIDILKALGIERAQLLVISFNEPARAMKILEAVRAHQLEIPVFVRTADDRELATLKAAGATEVVPEVLEASLTLVSHVLKLMGSKDADIFHTISEARGNRYQLLHGYYHGVRSRVLDASGQPLQLLHAVILPAKAYACGKSLAHLQLHNCGVQIETWHRGEQQLDASDQQLPLETGDRLVLRGSADQVEHAEARLLAG